MLPLFYLHGTSLGKAHAAESYDKDYRAYGMQLVKHRRKSAQGLRQSALFFKQADVREMRKYPRQERDIGSTKQTL